jgi:arginine/lysine/ornithine decarboxylase
LKSRTPFYHGLRTAAERLGIRCQAPGHGGDPEGLPPEMLELLQNFLHHDLSVVDGLDKPTLGLKTAWREAEEEAAAAVGAKDCAFFTTGASGAVKAAVGALCEVAQGGKILATRAGHISATDEFRKRGALVEYLPVELHGLGMDAVMVTDTWERALEQEGVRAAFLSTPGYTGGVGPLARWIKRAREKGVIVVVDSSWMSEGPFSYKFGPSAIQLGAAAEIGSPHKSLRVPGQCAWLWLGEGIPDHVLENCIRAEQTTSKNQVFLACLDLCRAWAVENVDQGIDANLQAIGESRDLVPDLLFDWGRAIRSGETEAAFGIPYRAVIETWKLGYSGPFVSDCLRDQFGMQVALPSPNFVCLGFGVNQPNTIRRAFESLGELFKRLPRQRPLDVDALSPVKLTAAEVNFAILREAKVIEVPFKEAIGQMLYYGIGGYPPGILLKAPGEVLTEADAEYLLGLQKQGGWLYGTPRSLMARGNLCIVVR